MITQCYSSRPWLRLRVQAETWPGAPPLRRWLQGRLGISFSQNTSPKCQWTDIHPKVYLPSLTFSASLILWLVYVFFLQEIINPSCHMNQGNILFGSFRVMRHQGLVWSFSYFLPDLNFLWIVTWSHESQFHNEDPKILFIGTFLRYLGLFQNQHVNI